MSKRAAAELVEYRATRSPGMSQQDEQSARDLLRQATYDTVRRIYEECLRAMADGEVTDAEGLEEYLHQECDTALTYTRDQWELAYFLDDSPDSDLSDAAEGFDAVLTARAYENLRHAVVRKLDDFDSYFEEADE